MSSVKEETMTLVVLKNIQGMVKDYLDHAESIIERIAKNEDTIANNQNKIANMDKNIFLISEDIKEIKKILQVEIIPVNDREALLDMLDKYKKKKFIMIPSFSKEC
jgi:hypothetical protein